MLVRTLVNKVLFVCKRSVENYFTPYLANKVLFAKVRSSVYKFIRCLAQIYTCCRLSSFGLTETAKYKLPYILYATCFAESAKQLRHKFLVAPPLADENTPTRNYNLRSMRAEEGEGLVSRLAACTRARRVRGCPKSKVSFLQTRLYSSDPTENMWSSLFVRGGRKVVNSSLDRWTVEIWSANKESLESSESQREHFVFS